MNKISRLLLYQGEQVEKQNMLWNMAGSFVYAFSSMVLSFLVMRIAGEDAGGIFALGFSTFGQQMFTLAYFGLRPFQITDQGAEHGGFSFGEYQSFRVMTTAAALLAAGGFSLWMQFSGTYSREKAGIVFLLAVYKIIDGYADVYESEFQRQGSLYLTGKSNTFRTIFSAAVFLAVLSGKKVLLFACMAAVAAQILGAALFICSVMGSFAQIDWKIRPKARMRLFSQSSLLFVSVFLDFYVFSAAKYAIDRWMNDAASGYFNLIFMPTSVIYLVANFVIRPFLTRMTDYWNKGAVADYLQIMKKISLIIGGLTVLAVGGTCVCGRFVLSLMEVLLGSGYKGSLTPYLSSFIIIVFGGGVYALANLLYYSLVIMRRQTWIFFVYLAAAGIAVFAAPFMVSHRGILGAALVYCMLMGILLAGFGGCAVLEIKGMYRKKSKIRGMTVEKAKKNLTVDVLIPVYKPGKKFSMLISMLNKQSYPINRILIINTEEQYWKKGKIQESKQMEVCHIKKEEFDHGGTRHFGMSLSQADIVICMTDDAVPCDHHLVENLVSGFLRRGPGGECPAMVYARQLPNRDCSLTERYTRRFNYPAKSRVKTAKDLPKLGIKTYFASNVCCAYDRKIYETQGGFIQRAIFNEDMIFACSAVRAGYCIVYQAEAKVFHSHHYNCRQQFQRNFDLGVSQADHPEVFADVPSEGEGVRLVKQTARYLVKSGHPWLLPSLLIKSGCKYLGYRTGKNYRCLPGWMAERCSMNRNYWKKAGEVR